MLKYAKIYSTCLQIVSFDNEHDRFHHNTHLSILVSYTETIHSVDKLPINFLLRFHEIEMLSLVTQQIKLSAGRVPSCWYPGRLHWALVRTHNPSQQTPGDWKKKLSLNCYYTYDFHVDCPLSLLHTHTHLQHTQKLHQKENLYLMHDENEEVSMRTFIILSLHFLPKESTSIFTVFKRWQNSCRHITTVAKMIEAWFDILPHIPHTHSKIYCSNKNILLAFIMTMFVLS